MDSLSTKELKQLICLLRKCKKGNYKYWKTMGNNPILGVDLVNEDEACDYLLEMARIELKAKKKKRWGISSAG